MLSRTETDRLDEADRHLDRAEGIVARLMDDETIRPHGEAVALLHAIKEARAEIYKFPQVRERFIALWGVREG